MSLEIIVSLWLLLVLGSSITGDAGAPTISVMSDFDDNSAPNLPVGFNNQNVCAMPF